MLFPAGGNHRGRAIAGFAGVQGVPEFLASILSVNADGTNGGPGVRTSYGMEIIAADFFKFEVADDPNARVTEATQAVAIAEQERLATVTKAKGEAEAIALVGEAKAKASGRRVQEAGEKVVIAETMSEAISAHSGTLVLGSNVPTPVMIDPNQGGNQ